MNGLAERDGWASHSSAQPSAPANKDAGACPTFFVRGGENVAPYSSSGDPFMRGSEGCCVNGLRAGRSLEEILQQRKRFGGGNLRIWVLHVDYPFFS